MLEEDDRRWLAEGRAERRGFLAAAGLVALASAVGARAAVERGLEARRITAEATARLAVLEGLARYCRGMDRSDRELQASIWHTDSTAQYLDHPVGPSARPLDSGQKFVESKLMTHHRILNTHIEVNGDRAVSEGYGDSVIRNHPDKDGILLETIYRGRYVDRWSLRDGRWAIEHRRYIAEMYNEHRYDTKNWPPFALRQAKFTRDDESYRYFG